MEQARARRILRLLGWGSTACAIEFNRVAHTRLAPQDINKQLHGTTRGISDALAVFLRMAVRVARLERQYRPDLCERRPKYRTRKPRKPV